MSPYRPACFLFVNAEEKSAREFVSFFTWTIRLIIRRIIVLILSQEFDSAVVERKELLKLFKHEAGVAMK